MNHRWIICYDFETDSPDPLTANPVELAAVAINPRTLEIKTDDVFKVTIKPPQIEKDEYFTDGVQKTIEWHAKTRACATEDIVSLWKNGLNQKIAIKNFMSFVSKYNIEKDVAKKIYYTEPLYTGYNVDAFDDIIMKRLCDEHKLKYPFAKAGNIDLIHIINYWFENLPEPDNRKLDTVKAFLGLESYGQAHEALSDVLDTAKIFVRFLKFSRKQSTVAKFKDSFKSQ